MFFKNRFRSKWVANFRNLFDMAKFFFTLWAFFFAKREFFILERFVNNCFSFYFALRLWIIFFVVFSRICWYLHAFLLIIYHFYIPKPQILHSKLQFFLSRKLKILLCFIRVNLRKVSRLENLMLGLRIFFRFRNFIVQNTIIFLYFRDNLFFLQWFNS